MKISYGSIEDMDFILEKDHHVNKELVEFKLNLGEYILAKDGNGNSIGWLRYNYFWDNTPFLNLIYVDERFRGRNLGKNLLDFWEAEMKKNAPAPDIAPMQLTFSPEQMENPYDKPSQKWKG